MCEISYIKIHGFLFVRMNEKKSEHSFVLNFSTISKLNYSHDNNNTKFDSKKSLLIERYHKYRILFAKLSTWKFRLGNILKYVVK